MAVNWTPELNATFREMRPNTPIEEMAVFFGTTKAAIRAHSLKLDIKLLDRNLWVEDEVVRLREMDDAGASVAAMARALNRTAGSVQWKLEDIGRKSNRKRAKDADDDALIAAASALRRQMTGKEAKTLATKIGRPVDGVRRRLAELGYEVKARGKRWNPDDLVRLRGAAARGDTLAQAAAYLGRAERTVRAAADRLDLVFATPKRADDAALVAKVATVFGADRKVSILKVARDLKLNPRRVKSLALKAGADLTPRTRVAPAPVTKEILLALAADGKTLSAAAKELHRDFRTLKPIAAELGVTFPAFKREATPKAPKAPKVRVKAVKVQQPTVAKAKAGKPKSAYALRPATPPLRVVKVNSEPAALRAVEAVKPPARPSFGRFAPAKRTEILDKASVDEAVQRFIALRGITKIESSPVEKAILAIRRLGYTVITKGSVWVLDGRLELGSAEELIEFARVRDSRSAELSMTT